MVSENITILFLGRVAGGVSTTLLFSVFEAWMISDYHERGLHIPYASPDPEWKKEETVVEVEDVGGSDGDSTSVPQTSLDSVFSTMTTLSCVVAIASGIVGDMLVAASGTRTWPFMAAMVCSVAAAAIISTGWVRILDCKAIDSTTDTNAA